MLSAHNLTYERHFSPVFEPVTLSVTAGEVHVVTGANGAGKTTLIRLLAGLLRPAEGAVERRVAHWAYLGHQLAVKDDLSVRENLDFSRALLGGRGTSTAEALATLDLESCSAQAARTLSAGQRKRCALARLLLDTAPLWLLDEPYANLDRAGVATVDDLLRHHLAAGGACVMSTHGDLRPAGVPLKDTEVRRAEHCR